MCYSTQDRYEKISGEERAKGVSSVVGEYDGVREKGF